MDDAGGHRTVPLYNKFVEQAISLNPSYIAMITPSRWTAGGLGLTEYRAKMLSDKRIRHFVDYPMASELFPGVEIKGGVSYFLWDRDNPGKCKMTMVRGEETIGPVERDFGEFDVLVRDSRAMPILKKVLSENSEPFSSLIASVRPFGDEMRSNFKKFDKKKQGPHQVKLYMNEGSKRQVYWVDPKYVTNNKPLIQAWKVFLPTAYGAGETVPHQIIGQPIIGEPGSVSTETYLAIGPFESKVDAEHAMAYLTTRFARFLISLRKPAQHNIPSTFNWVPILDWTETWDDQRLFEKFGITEAEQTYIASLVREMSL
jgi:site-specific DNA-methyltransferase (adenine-specific)